MKLNISVLILVHLFLVAPKSEGGIRSLVLSGVYNVYQAFISPNDNNRCAFSPSCSRYAKEALETRSFFKALLLTGDRLHRCNGLHVSDYPIDASTGLASDPVDR